MSSEKPDSVDEMTKANNRFSEDAIDVIYDDGTGLRKAKPNQFSFREHDYMRSLRGRNNTFLMVIDIDSLEGLNEDVLNCAKDLFKYFGARGVLKASGIKGLHIIPYKIHFPDHFKDGDITMAMRNIAYSAYVESGIQDKYNFQFLKRTSCTPINTIKHGYIDLAMYNQNQRIRGFCRRFKNNRKINAWSVPVKIDDTYETVVNKVHLMIEPDWNIDIPIVEFDESFITHKFTFKSYEKTEIKQIETLEGTDTIEKIKDKIYREMPKKVRMIWDSDDPSHDDKFAVVCWLNHSLKRTIQDTGKRISLVSVLIQDHMSLKSYRENGRFSPLVIQNQVNQIITREYACPHRLLEDEEYEEWKRMIEGLAEELDLLGKEDIPEMVLSKKFESELERENNVLQKQDPYLIFKQLMCYPGLDIILVTELAEKNLYPEEAFLIINKGKKLSSADKDIFQMVLTALESVKAIELTDDRELKPDDLLTNLKRFNGDITKLISIGDKPRVITLTAQGSEWLDKYRSELYSNSVIAPEIELGKNDKTLTFDYLDNYFERGYGTCEWKMQLPEGLDWAFIESARDQTDSLVKPDSRQYIKRANKGENPPIYILTIQGRGKDNRCRWCKSFRAYCQKTSEGQGFTFNQDGKCKFE